MQKHLIIISVNYTSIYTKGKFKNWRKKHTRKIYVLYIYIHTYILTHMYILNIETHVWKEELEKATQVANLLSYVVKPRLNSRT